MSRRSKTIGDYDHAASGGPVPVLPEDFAGLMAAGLSEAVSANISHHMISKNHLDGTRVNNSNSIPGAAKAPVEAANAAGKMKYQTMLPSGLESLALSHCIIDSGIAAAASYSFSGSGPLLGLAGLEKAIGDSPGRIDSLRAGNLQLMVRRVTGKRRILSPSEVAIIRAALPQVDWQISNLNPTPT